MIKRPNTESVLSDVRLKQVVDIWKHSVDVQMHFNDMGMRIRNLYFTFLAAAIGLIGVIQGKHIDSVYPGLSVHLVLFVMAAIVPISMLFHFLDGHWYHRLLLGAVDHCKFIETRYKDALPEIQLGKTISARSPVIFDGIGWRLWFFLIRIRDERYWKDKKFTLHSDAKIEVLYKSVIICAVAITLLYSIFGGVEFHGCTVFALMTHGKCATPATPWGFPLPI
jgi:hypothetical protein